MENNPKRLPNPPQQLLQKPAGAFHQRPAEGQMIQQHARQHSEHRKPPDNPVVEPVQHPKDQYAAYHPVTKVLQADGRQSVGNHPADNAEQVIQQQKLRPQPRRVQPEAGLSADLAAHLAKQPPQQTFSFLLAAFRVGQLMEGSRQLHFALLH